MHTELISYHDDEAELEGFVAFLGEGKHPLILLCHAWRGRDDFICEQAKQVAAEGYVAFAIDMYGKDILGKSGEECMALKKPFIQDRLLLQRRAIAGLEAACRLPYVDANKVAVIGFGFGGISALDLARSGANLRGVVSVYGHFDPPPPNLTQQIQAKVLAIHGYLDPIVRMEEFTSFEKEMTEAKIDWQAHIYGKAMHAFATPGANSENEGILYDPIMKARAWVATKNFLEEIFA